MMKKRFQVWLLLFGMACFSAPLFAADIMPKVITVTPQERLEYIRRARIWFPVDTASRDLLRGPEGEGSFEFNQPVTCDYVPFGPGAPKHGSTSKFWCRTKAGDKLRIRYDADNGEVFGMVAGTRLLWALGFGADRSYPVRVTCLGCPADPWDDPNSFIGDQLFDPATVDRKLDGATIEVPGSVDEDGWAWNELDLIDEKAGGSSKTEVDAFRLLAAFMQHGDNRAEQQKLFCPRDGIVKYEDGRIGCRTPIMYIHDVGSTFGASTKEYTEKCKMDLREWSRVPVWKDKAQCVATLDPEQDGTMGNPKISEAGRVFLLELLDRLSEQQLKDLFTAARVTQRGMGAAASVDEWVREFVAKREQIRAVRCPE